MSFIDLASKIRVRCGRKKTGSPTLYSQPGAHTGDTRQYIPGYSDSNIIFRAPTTGNDANDGLTAGTPKQTKSACDTAAGSTKKIRIIEACTLNESVSKPTEMKRGVSGTISSSLTAPVDTWTQAATPSFGAEVIWDCEWVPFLSKYVAVGDGGKIATSPDGNTWTQRSLTGTAGQYTLFAVAHSAEKRVCVAVGNPGPSGSEIVYSTDGITWQYATMPGGPYGMRDVTYVEELGKFVACGADWYLLTSSDGQTWEISFTYRIGESANCIFHSKRLSKLFCTTTNGLIFSGDIAGSLSQIADSSFGTSTIYDMAESNSLLVAVGGSGKIAYSSDGTTWTQAATPSFGTSIVYSVKYVAELGVFLACSFAGKIAYSSDGDTWMQAATPSFGGSDLGGISYSPLLGKIVICGYSGKIAYSTAFANTISASIAGFTVQAVQYSGTVTAYNCTMKQPGTTAALSLNACRLTESGAHISNNAQAHFGTLVEGDFNITCTPASQNAVAINCNTIAGRLSIFNASSTLYEQIRDNIIDGGFYASSACLIQSGNLRGTYTNATLSSKVSNGQDPVFVDETDYKIKRITNGDSQDSPLCNAALYYVNEAGYDRDVGAWSYDDTDNATEYQRTFYLNKPAGNGISITKVQSANAYQGDSGEWDSYNNPARASEHLTLTYQSAVPVDHIDFQDYFESLDDMTCDVNLDPQNDSPSTAITVNGNHAVDDVVLNIDASTTIKGGMHFTTGGNTYYAVYVTPAGNATKIILDRPLVASISDNTSITPASVAGDGEYQYLPQNRDGKRPMGQETEYLGGCVFKFVRPWQ